MRALSVIAIMFASCSVGAQVQRVDLKTAVSTHVTTFHLDATNLLEAATRISSTFGIPMGIAWRGPVAAEKRISGDWKDLTVGDLLKNITAQDPSYKLDVTGSVIHIRPAGYEDNHSNFLNIKLSAFSADGYTHVIGMKLRDRLNEMLVPRPSSQVAQACGGSVGIGFQEARTAIAVVNAPVEEILDLLLLNSHYQVWLVIFEPDITYNGYLGTASIYRTTKESDQPNWDFLSRYYDPLERKERRDWALTPSPAQD